MIKVDENAEKRKERSLMETVPWGLALLTSLEMSKGLTIIVLHEVLQIGGERFLKQRVFRSVARRPMKSSPVLLWMPEVMSGAEQGPPVPVAGVEVETRGLDSV